MPGDEVDDARRNARRLGRLGDDIGLERRFGRWLHDHRAAGEQSIGDLVGHNPERPVPRRDGGNDADRFIGDQRSIGGHARAALDEFELFGKARDLCQRHDAAAVHRAGKRGEPAHLRGPRLGELGHAGFEMRDHAAECSDTIGRGRGWPGTMVEGRARCGHGGIHVGLVGFSHAPHDLLGVG